MHLGAPGKAVRVQSCELSLQYEIILPTVYRDESEEFLLTCWGLEAEHRSGHNANS